MRLDEIDKTILTAIRENKKNLPRGISLSEESIRLTRLLRVGLIKPNEGGVDGPKFEITDLGEKLLKACERKIEKWSDEDICSARYRGPGREEI